ncbi:MAG: ATP-binding cassette domain-containing protein, partial [Desulfonatronovibrionaceae bacterium]
RQKIALAGPNGSGKSTLLKLITGSFKPDQGQISLGRNTRTGYFAQHQTETLVLENTVLSEIRRLGADNLTEEEIRSVLGLFMLDETFWQRPVSSLSGGEKSRLILASLFLTRANLFLLDEPTNHLDMETREALVAALRDFPGALMVIAHDRYFLTRVVQEVWTVQQQGIIQHGTGFEEYYSRMLEKESQPRDSSSAGKKGAESCSQKEKRRQEAKIRNRIYQKLKPLKQEYADKEARLETGLERQEEVETILARPETYSDQQRFTELTREYQKLVDENEVLMLRMENLEQEINRLEADRP